MTMKAHSSAPGVMHPDGLVILDSSVLVKAVGTSNLCGCLLFCVELSNICSSNTQLHVIISIDHMVHV